MIASPTDFRGRVALVTGAHRGIGRAICEAYASLGATVFLSHAPGVDDWDRDSWPSELTITADVTQPESTQAMLSRVAERCGQLDILVNNAGVYPRARLADISEELWDRVQDVNLKGAFLCARAALPLLEKSAAGRIINIASTAAAGGPVCGAHYAASKAGLLGLTRSLARAFAPRVLVNAIAPGMTDTLQPIETASERAEVAASLPMGRIAQPADVAKVAVFFASELSAYVTGQVLFLHGGSMQVV